MAYEYSFEKEYYKCWDCGKKLQLKDISHTWKCPSCGGTVMVYGKQENEYSVALRKLAEELSDGDSVLMYPNNYHEVLDNSFKNGKYRIALKGYGVIKADSSDWFNCAWGRWDGDETKL